MFRKEYLSGAKLIIFFIRIVINAVCEMEVDKYIIKHAVVGFVHKIF